jgi:hypothetical protein
MCLRFVFFLITRMVSWLRLSRREEACGVPEVWVTSGGVVCEDGTV